MFTQFPEYYRIGRKDLLEKFDDIVFVFDACALLDIFRLKKGLVENIFSAIEHYKDRIYVPSHAAWEYNRRVNGVLEEQINKISSAQKAFDTFGAAFQSQRNYPYVSDTASKMMDKLGKQIEKDFREQHQYLENQLVCGEYQNRMSKLLDGHVLKPFSESEINDIEKEGEERYSNKIPPGWKDASKGDNRYGDLINWKEILRFAKDCGKSIIFVTNDKKEDWIVKVMGKKLGVQPFLLKEFYNTTENTNQLFHVYTLENLLSLINEHDNTVVTEDTIKDVEKFMHPADSIASISDVMTSVVTTLKMPDYVKNLLELQETMAQLYGRLGIKPISAVSDKASEGDPIVKEGSLEEEGKCKEIQTSLKSEKTSDNNKSEEPKEKSDVGEEGDELNRNKYGNDINEEN